MASITGCRTMTVPEHKLKIKDKADKSISSFNIHLQVCDGQKCNKDVVIDKTKCTPCEMKNENY